MIGSINLALNYLVKIEVLLIFFFIFWFEKANLLEQVENNGVILT